MRHKQIIRYLVKACCTLKQALPQLETIPEKTLLVVDNDEKFLGTLTDGDIRRYLSANIDYPMSVSVSEVMNRRCILEEKHQISKINH